MFKIDGKEQTVSLSMIVKADADTTKLKAAVESARPYVDEIVVDLNGDTWDLELNANRMYLNSVGAKIVNAPWTRHFGEARNFCLKHCTKDYILWLDHDDTLENGKNLNSVCEMTFRHENVGALWTNWHYSHDEAGNCRSVLIRERVFKRTWFKWVGRLHEAAEAVVDARHTILKDDGVFIKHHATEKEIAESAERNLVVILEQYKIEHETGNIDSKTVLDTARSLQGMGQDERALTVYMDYVDISGYDDDRAYAYKQIAEIYRKTGNYKEAKAADSMVWRLKPHWPDAYIGAGSSAFLEQRFDEAIHLLTQSMNMEIPFNTQCVDPMYYIARPLMMLMWAFYEKAEYEAALQAIERAKPYYPQNQYILDLETQVKTLMRKQSQIDGLISLKKDFEDNKDENRLMHLLGVLTDDIAGHPAFVRLKNRMNPRKLENRMVIQCGQTIEPWSPKDEKTGIGGSEEAVINMARLFQKMGYMVEVFCDTNAPGNYDGVEYRPFWEYDHNEECAVFIAWRNSMFIDGRPEKAKVVLLWLHDIQRMAFYNPDRIEHIDRLIPLSKFHRDNLKEIPDEKFWISRNGINTSQFGGPDAELKKIKNKCIYASSPDRGLDVVLDIWPDIIKQNPEATLHIYYGFSKTYDKHYENDSNGMKFKTECMKKISELPGITYHGRVGHQELALAFLSSEWWLYPTYFDEISCITAMKAQAAGAYPICTDKAALEETVQYGYKQRGNILDDKIFHEYKDRTLKIIADGHPSIYCTEMRKWALENYSWEAVAKEWDILIKKLLEENNAKKSLAVGSEKVSGKETGEPVEKTGSVKKKARSKVISISKGPAGPVEGNGNVHEDSGNTTPEKAPNP